MVQSDNATAPHLVVGRAVALELPDEVEPRVEPHHVVVQGVARVVQLAPERVEQIDAARRA